MDHQVSVTYVVADTILEDGKDPELGICVAVTYREPGKGRKARSGISAMLFDRGTLVELITEIAYRGAQADRELPSELTGAIEAGVEKARKEAVR